MTKLEEVVRALCVGIGSESACCGGCGVKVDQARAALAVLREPSVSIKEAVGEFIYEAWGDQKAIAKEAWQAGIDAVLSEAPGKAGT